MLFFSFNKDENWFATLTKFAILKTKLLAGNDHVIDIWKISHCVFSVSYCQPYDKKEHYTVAQRYGFNRLLASEPKILFLPLQHKFDIFSQLCSILSKLLFI